nr:glycoside hydrolase family 16 protein [Streptococcus equinus]
MELRTGANGDMFDCTWQPDNVSFTDDGLTLKIDKDQDGYTGGEWRTRECFHYGRYQVRMKAIKNTGVVTSFFTYTGPTDGTKWDEIDIEFLGKDTTKVQFNYFTDGVGNHEYLYDLGFDASEDWHTYGFEWQADHITWYVDGKAVHTVTENLPVTPGKIMMNVWPGIGVDDWLDPYDGKTPLYGHYDWIHYDK